MKKMILQIIVACLVTLSFVGCNSERICIVQYTFANNTAFEVNITRWNYLTDTQPDKIVILPGEEYIDRNGFPRFFVYPFFENGIYQLAADNGERFVLSTRSGETMKKGLFNTQNYELVYDSKCERKRHYRFIFTDDYFKDGEPIENMPE